MINPTQNKKPATTEAQNDSESQKISEIQRLQEQAEEYLNGWKRAKADYLNREKEIEKEKVQWIKFANLELILNLLPILDSFEQSIKQLAITEAQKPATTETQNRTEAQNSQIQSLGAGEASSEIQCLRGWAKGVLKIKEQFEGFLKNQGVEKIKTIGEKFNPEFHEVIEKKALPAEASAKEGAEGEIIEEVQAGYTMHGQVIRPAKVIIK